MFLLNKYIYIYIYIWSSRPQGASVVVSPARGRYMSYDHPISGHFGDNLLPEDCGLTNAVLAYINNIMPNIYIYTYTYLYIENLRIRELFANMLFRWVCFSTTFYPCSLDGTMHPFGNHTCMACWNFSPFNVVWQFLIEMPFVQEDFRASHVWLPG